jgi:exosome complex component RRP46
VLAAVYGPIAPQRPSVEQPDSAVISIIFNGHREYESLLQTILEGCICVEEYARCVIEVVLQTIRDDGSVLGCAVHATVAALMDAGISMTRMPLATSVALSLSRGRGDDDNDDAVLLLDPNEEEEQHQTSLTLITSNLEPDCMLGSMCEGKLSLERLLACQEAASRATPSVLAFMRLAIEQKVMRQSQTLWAVSN